MNQHHGTPLACSVTMEYEPFMDRVARRGAFESDDVALRAARAVITALAGFLVPDEAQALAAALPSSFVPLVVTSAVAAEPGRDAMFQRVAALEIVPLALATEHTVIVLQVLSDLLPEETRIRLARHLGPELGELLSPMPAPDEPPAHIHRPPTVAPGGGHTLATGRPGSRHPLSEATPERAHTHSVVRSDNPHGDTKLSSTEGLTQEREHETLAEGRPGPARPIAEAGERTAKG
ncbi:MAG: DUF2267 domain-containing protein [Polyangiaceae bacterium]|nr:DUF2267 domain-containing protein [Polyangiaceae bacterium]